MLPGLAGRSGRLRLALPMCRNGTIYIYISFEQLERTAQEWLGWPFDKSALPQVDYLLQKENCLYADVQMLLKSWPSPMFHPREYDIFAVPFKIYLEQDTWIMKGEVWGFQ